MSMKNEIYLVALTDHEILKEHIKTIEPIVTSLKVIKISKTKGFLSLLKSIFNKLPFQILINYDKQIAKSIKNLASKWKPDHIFCQLPRMAEYAIPLPYPKTIDYMDAFGIGMERRANVVSGITSKIYALEAKRMKIYEKNIFEKFDNHIIISQQDANQININKSHEIKVIPNGIDTKFFLPQDKKAKYDIGFIGNMGYPPNIDAAEYLINKLRPNLSNNLTYLIAGARPDKRVKLLADKNVCITGWIDDVREAYSDCKIFVVPMWSGTGQQNKIMEAMAMGIPCITTSPVNNAIKGRHGIELLVADNESEFRQCIVTLLNDTKKYKEIQKNALIFVQNNFSWSHSVNMLLETMASK